MASIGDGRRPLEAAVPLENGGIGRRGWVGFSVGALRCAVPAKRVGSIIPVDLDSAAPIAPGKHSKCILVGDLIVPLKDLGADLGTGHTPGASRTAALLVVLRGAAKRAVVLGLVVDEVLGLYDLGPDEITPPSGGWLTLPSEMVIGLGRDRWTQMLLLDVDALATEEERSLAAMLNTGVGPPPL